MEKLMTREELLTVPTCLYDEMTNKQFNEAIKNINKDAVIARRWNERHVCYDVGKYTQDAINKLQDECTKAGFKFEFHYNEVCLDWVRKGDKTTHNWVEVKW